QKCENERTRRGRGAVIRAARSEGLARIRLHNFTPSHLCLSHFRTCTSRFPPSCCLTFSLSHFLTFSLSRRCTLTSSFSHFSAFAQQRSLERRAAFRASRLRLTAKVV